MKEVKNEKPKAFSKPDVMRSIICYFFGHRFKLIKEYQFFNFRKGCCSRCNKKMYGAEMKGELTGVTRWIYVIGSIDK